LLIIIYSTWILLVEFCRDRATLTESWKVSERIARRNPNATYLSFFAKIIGWPTGIDTLGYSEGSRVSWFPRPDANPPTESPERFAEALREEAQLWYRNREVLGTTNRHADWRGYSPPFDHVLIFLRSAP